MGSVYSKCGNHVDGEFHQAHHFIASASRKAERILRHARAIPAARVDCQRVVQPTIRSDGFVDGKAANTRELAAFP
jgi:hypothetical protein